jgi:folate-binding protein YgfZ
MSVKFVDNLLPQYAALTRDTGVVDFSSRTQIELTGADRAAFLHNFCTNEIKKLQPGGGCEAFITSTQGKILGHVLVFCRSDSLVLETVPGQAQALIAHLDRYLIREKVELHDRSSEWNELLVGGAQSETLLRSLIEADLPAAPNGNADVKLAGITVSIRRVEIISAASFLVVCAAAETDSLRRAIEQAGGVMCDDEAFNIARLEAGWPLYGRDITDKNLPQEVSRDAKAISLVKGCYLGQETVARIDAMGHVNRHLVGLKFSGPDFPADGCELLVSEKSVGHVTSAVYSPQLDAPLALGYVRREHSPVGTKFSSAAGTAEIIRLPLAK